MDSVSVAVEPRFSSIFKWMVQQISMVFSSPTLTVFATDSTEDTGILYDGGTFNSVRYPSAIKTVSDWATRNGCTGILVDSSPNLNIDAGISGDETRVQNFTDCPPAGEVELWTILGGSHAPRFNANWSEMIWAFFSSHPKI